MGSKRKKEELNVGVMILCIIGTVSVVFGILLLKNENFKLKVLSAEGTVSGVTVSRNANGEVESRSVNLSYIANNSNYSATINNYKDEIKIGDKLTLYYDFLSPEAVSDKRSGYVGYLATIIGIILVLKTGPRFIRIIKDNYLS